MRGLNGVRAVLADSTSHPTDPPLSDGGITPDAFSASSTGPYISGRCGVVCPGNRPDTPDGTGGRILVTCMTYGVNCTGCVAWTARCGGAALRDGWGSQLRRCKDFRMGDDSDVRGMDVDRNSGAPYGLAPIRHPQVGGYPASARGCGTSERSL